nr:Chain A, VAL-LYS-TRP-VAL-LYS-LYS-VAL-VAL-LYS-TRP-VAL-LYS-LYS-VAL [synthetic construct]
VKWVKKVVKWVKKV